MSAPAATSRRIDHPSGGTSTARGAPGRGWVPGRLARYAWVPIPLLLALIAVLWVADLRGVYESRAAMVFLNLSFTWLASLCVALLAARGFLASGQPGLLMFGCGAIVWGITSLAAATIIDRVNATVTTHNLGVLGAAVCHAVGVQWRGRRVNPGRWLPWTYAGGLAVSALICWAAVEGVTPLFFVQGRGGTLVRDLVLAASVVLFAWVAWHMTAASRGDPNTMRYWYGLGLGLVATGLVGVLTLTVQGGALGWVNRLTQYLGSAYLLVAAFMASREARPWTLSLAGVNELVRLAMADGRGAQSPLGRVVRPVLAVAAVAVGAWLHLWLETWSGPGLPPHVTLYPAIMASALLLGVGPGLVATVAASLAAWLWLLHPAEAVAETPQRIELVLFVFNGLLMTALAGLYRHVRDKAAAYDREAALRESRERLAAFAEATFEGITESENGRIIDCNEQLARMLGYQVAELRRMGVAELVAPEDRERVLENTRARRDSTTEHSMIRKDGTRIVVEAHGWPVAPGSARRHTAFRDVTARRQAEDALRDSDRRKTEFLALLSHELRTPLAPIVGGIRVLELAPAGGEKARCALGAIRRQAAHLSRLVDDLLAFTRLAHGRIELRREPLDLREVVRQATDDVRAPCQEASIGLRVELPEEPVGVDGDATRLAQVLANLLQNAVKFTPPGGGITVRLAAEGALAGVTVRDSGAGLEPGLEERIFEPFAQGDQGLARTRGGLGLGLAIVRQLVELHQGTVRASSAGLGLGSEFVVTLPVAPLPPQPQQRECATLRRAEGPGRSVLVIEDNADSGQSMVDLLELTGHRARLAPDGRTGLRLAREERPEIVLCDLGLPDMDGFEVARTLRADPVLQGVRLVALTGYAQPEDRERAFGAGFDAHLAKPPPLDALEALLRQPTMEAGVRILDGPALAVECHGERPGAGGGGTEGGFGTPPLPRAGQGDPTAVRLAKPGGGQ